MATNKASVKGKVLGGRVCFAAGRASAQHLGAVEDAVLAVEHRPAAPRGRVPEGANGSSLTGCIVVEQIKSVDFTNRKAKFVEKAPAPILNEVLAILDACLYGSL